MINQSYASITKVFCHAFTLHKMDVHNALFVIDLTYITTQKILRIIAV